MGIGYTGEGVQVVASRKWKGRQGGQKEEKNSKGGIHGERALERVKASRVGKEAEGRLGRARVAEEVGERRGGFELYGGKEGSTLGGVERAVEEEVFAGFGFAAASTHELVALKVCFVGAEVASTGSIYLPQGGEKEGASATPTTMLPSPPLTFDLVNEADNRLVD